ncbi:MAG: NAD(+) diphosphatase [Plesiomonas sp.]
MCDEQKTKPSTVASWWMLCFNGQLWLPEGQIPHGTAEDLALLSGQHYRLGTWRGSPVWLVIGVEKPTDEWHSVRSLLDNPVELFQLAGRAVQLTHFLRTHRFCGQCGQPMRKLADEWSVRCTGCQQCHYPVIAPCVIMAVRKGRQILLAQHPRHQGNMYTVLAGFVEAGETLEQAVEREVREEVGIAISHIRYVKSQPWPFPNSLMMAFLADYADGELCIDTTELVDANWFSAEQLPLLPPAGTVARELIDQTLLLCAADHAVEPNSAQD